jgi:hypothetical protein
MFLKTALDNYVNLPQFSIVQCLYLRNKIGSLVDNDSSLRDMGEQF